MQRDELVGFLDRYLETGPEERDYGPNGLQVEGRAEVGRVVTGVSACLELFEAAAELNADAVLVHHGLFWDGDPLPLTGLKYRRVERLMRDRINLIAYHLPLDRHPEVGNNAVAAKRLGLMEVRPFGELDGRPLGVAGRLSAPSSPGQFVELCAEVFEQRPQHFSADRSVIETVGLVSGAAQRMFHQAIDAGLDAFVTGEVSEWVVNVARETATHYLAAGHYATERLGIRALGERIASELDLDVRFVDVPNPV